MKKRIEKIRKRARERWAKWRAELRKRIDQDQSEVDARIEKIRKEAEENRKPKFFSRSDWGARPARQRDAMTSTSNGVFIHHSVGKAPTTVEEEKAVMRSIQDFHMDTNRWNDIAYSFVVMPSGNVYEGRGKNVAGAHTEGYNSSAYGICGAGNYEVNKPSDAMVRSMRWVRRKYLGLADRPVRPHGAVNQTACPGQHLLARINEL